jgi:release factor glutamine methyltransferase
VATAGELLRETRARLSGAGIATADAEARWLLGEASGVDPLAAEIDDGVVSARARRTLDGMIERRVCGEPLQYVLGSWSFRGIDLMVDHRVLVPRPETEITAQIAIDEAVRRGARHGRDDGGRAGAWTAAVTEYSVADLGTGSAAIALALATELPEAAVWATDVSPEALAVARANLAGMGSAAARVRLLEGDWFDALPEELRGRLRVVVANPPYIADAEVADLPPEVARYEPRLALVSGPTGLEAISRVIAGAGEWLEPGGALVVELAPHQAADAAGRARAAGLGDVRVELDLSGRERVLVARLA